MAAILNPAALTFSADQVRSINELITSPVLLAPELNLVHTLVPGIKNDREIGIAAGSLGLVGKAAQGCGTRNPQTVTNTIALKTWAPKRLEILLRQCYTDLESSFLKFARRTGINVYDLTSPADQQNAYMAYIVDMLQKDIAKTILRKAWFDDTAAALVTASPAGNITAGQDVSYFNLIDGIFKQLATIYAADSDRKTAIAANAQATQALQFSAFTSADAYAALNAVVDAATPELTAQSDRLLIVTQSVAQKAYRYLQSKAIVYNIDYQINGFGVGSWDGIPMYVAPLWDQYIKAYENNGTKLNSPHRIVYTTKSNLNIGMEANSLFDSIDVWMDKTTKYNYIEAIDAMDAKVLIDSLVQVGI